MPRREKHGKKKGEKTLNTGKTKLKEGMIYFPCLYNSFVNIVLPYKLPLQIQNDKGQSAHIHTV